MPRRHKHHKRRTMKGGYFWDDSSEWFSNLKQKTSDLWSKAKNKMSSLTGSTPSYTPTYTPPAPSPAPAPMPAPAPAPMPAPMPVPSVEPGPAPMPAPAPEPTTSSYGGKTKKRRMRGGFKDNTVMTGLAANAAPFSGKTAQPQTIVGGKTKKRHHKRRKHRHTKSCKHNKH